MGGSNRGGKKRYLAAVATLSLVLGLLMSGFMSSSSNDREKKALTKAARDRLLALVPKTLATHSKTVVRATVEQAAMHEIAWQAGDEKQHPIEHPQHDSLGLMAPPDETALQRQSARPKMDSKDRHLWLEWEREVSGTLEKIKDREGTTHSIFRPVEASELDRAQGVWEFVLAIQSPKEVTASKTPFILLDRRGNDNGLAVSLMQTGEVNVQASRP